METIIYIILSCLLVASVRIWDAVKSGCFYNQSRLVTSESREKDTPKILVKFIKNIHYVQTPFWYSLFGAFGIMLFSILRLVHPNVIWMSLLSAYLISQGVSAMVGPFYQGFINLGCGLPFVNSQENKKMELANPFTNKTIWIPRFWYGKNRVYLAFGGFLMIIGGMYLAFMK